MPTENTTIDRDSYVPPSLWGKDHWSTLAYIETRMVDGPVRVAFDPRMRQKRRTFRVLAEAGRRKFLDSRGIPMSPEHGTRLSDGTYLPWHDDWDCIEDMLAAGLFEGSPEDWDAGFPLRLTKLGRKIVFALRGHKSGGGSFSNFECTDLSTQSASA